MSLMSVVSTVSGIENTFKRFESISSDALDLFDTFNSTSVSDMFNKSGLSIDGIKRRLEQDTYNIEKLQHGDVFHFEIARQAPSYDSLKSKVISTMVKSVDILIDGMDAEEIQVGSGFYNYLSSMQSGEIQVSFHEFEDGDVVDFLTKVSSMNSLDGEIGSLISQVDGTIQKAQGVINGVGGAIDSINGFSGADIGKSGLYEIGNSFSELSNLFGIGNSYHGNKGGRIIPSDGTFLLPYDYYFSIKMSHIVRNKNTNMSYEKVIIEDDYLLSGNVSLSYATGEERYLEASATFKPLKSWRN